MTIGWSDDAGRCVVEHQLRPNARCMALDHLGSTVTRPVVWVGVGDAPPWDYGLDLMAPRDDPVTLVKDADGAGRLQGWIR